MITRRYSRENEKRFILIISIIFVILTIYLLKDLISILIFSVILAYFLFPIYNFYFQKTQKPRMSSILTILTATICIFLPLLLLSYFLVLSLIKLVVEYKFYIENPDVLNAIITNFMAKFTNSEIFSAVNFSELFNSLVLYILNMAKSFFAAIPGMLLYGFIILFIVYYILVYNREIFLAINEYVPLTIRKQNEIMRNISKNLKVLFRGYFLTAIIQTGVALVGYIIFAVPNLFIITFLTLITALIPYLGTPMVWVPVSFYMIITGNEYNGVGLLLFGAFIISLVDNFVRPILMSDKETISPPLVFLGFIGGMFVFGIQGIILGPIIISITAILLRYLKESYEFKE